MSDIWADITNPKPVSVPPSTQNTPLPVIPLQSQPDPIPPKVESSEEILSQLPLPVSEGLPSPLPVPNSLGNTLIDIADENESNSFLSKHFYKSSSKKAFIVGLVIFTILPASICIITAYIGGVWTLDSGVGFFRDYAGASYFSLGILLPILVMKMMNLVPTTIESLSNVIELKGEGSLSNLTREHLDDLVSTYSYLYCKETGRSMDGVSLPNSPELLSFIRRMLMVKKIIIALCAIYVLATMYNRFIGVGDIMLWHFYDASAIAYVGRSISEIMLGAIMGPLVLYPIILCVMITFHSLGSISSANALVYIRFSKDEAGGLGEYGLQSFMNTVALLPYSIILIGVIYQARELGTSLSASTAGATVVYLLLLLFVFFFPLSSAAVSMAKLKRAELTIVSEHYANYYEKFKLSLISGDNLSSVLENSEAMIAAEQVFDGIMNQPSVPYSKALVGRLAGIIAPVFGVIGSLFIF